MLVARAWYGCPSVSISARSERSLARALRVTSRRRSRCRAATSSRSAATRCLRSLTTAGRRRPAA
eukprot:scaffold75792_cov65-Phaeocystis_antarctica.AAC.11